MRSVPANQIHSHFRDEVTETRRGEETPPEDKDRPCPCPPTCWAQSQSSPVTATAGPETQERYAWDTGPAGHCSENDFQEVDYMWQEIINCVLRINGIGGRVASTSARAQAVLQTKLLLNINI